MTSNEPSDGSAQFDYIVVGSGAGGGPLAARLAQAGSRVLVLEAGPDHAETPGDARDITLVPGLHAVSTEHKALSWPFFVKHYSETPTGADPKGTLAGIFYPRATGIGGCTIHNAMITMAGPDSDWDDMADFLADDSWRGGPMRAYFQRLEHNDYQPLPTPSPGTWWGRLFDLVKWLFGRDPDHTRGGHGFDGWLHTSLADARLALWDKQLVKMIGGAVFQGWRAGLNRGRFFVRGVLRNRIAQDLDPNHRRTQSEHPEGLAMVPLAVCGERVTIHQNSETPFVMRGRRSSPRELLLETRSKFPDKLVIWTDAFVTKVLFEGDKRPRAVGVSYLSGRHLYKAHEKPSAPSGEPRSVFVKPGGDVIVCGGAFNTPQLLMLSGIGDASHLNHVAEGANNSDACTLTGRNGEPLKDDQGRTRRIDLPGVGRNLQDRYEVTVISQMRGNFAALDDAQFTLHGNDRHLKQWRAEGTGLYTSNGAVLGILKRSSPDLLQPDLFIFGIPLPFYGYQTGYSVSDVRNQFTWTILKAHTRNNDGTVELRSTDPLEPPEINFHYFNEVTCAGRSADDPDLVALVDGVKFVRGIAKHANWFTKLEEHYPGKKRLDPTPPLPAVTDDEGTIKDWIRREAWGHHACGTCRMGPPDDQGAVLDSRFRVREVDGLRVVDASIFPRIPGYFIVTNIYMASEKAADVILEDARYGLPNTVAYPRELRVREGAAISIRRKAIGQEAPALPQPGPDHDGTWPKDVAGLALSGGGVRSATFNLGVVQALARAQWLRRIDILSTVSGGGYIGAFLGRWYDRLRPQSEWGGLDGQSNRSAAARVERELTDPDSPAIAWLRKHGNYLAPRGAGESAYYSAIFLRSFLSVHFVVGLLLFSVFGASNWVRYRLLEPGTALVGFLGVSPADFPIGHLLQATLAAFYSPWFIAFEIVLLFMVVPRIIAYWIVSQDHHQRYEPVPLFAMLIGSGLVLYAAVGATFDLALLLIGIAPLISLMHVELAWRRGRVREQAIGRGSVETQRLRTRNYLTDDLGMALVLAGGALAFALIDTAGHGLQQYVARNEVYLRAFAAFGVTLAGLIPVLRVIATYMLGDSKAEPRSAVARFVKKQIFAGLLAVGLFAVPLVFVSFAAHAAYQGGLAVQHGLLATVAAFLLTAIFAHPAALTFVNRSSLTQTYAAKLARAYLGATNPLRHHPQAANITEVAAGDDVESIRNYTPHLSGGPLHLINITVNQTVDFTSQRGNRDRQGENVSVSSIGMTVGQASHAAWADLKHGGSTDIRRKRPTALEPLGHVPGTDHPLIDEAGVSAQRAEMLSLRQWIAISGAAFGPARGQSTSLGTALMFGLANLRTGYWWNSGIAEVGRDGYPALTALRRVFYLVGFLFQTHALLLSEWIARFSGPWDQYWYLSDGGHFEVLGAYELIRRRIPRIIVCDASADPDYTMDSIANLIRKVRIDFDAEVVPFSPADYAGVPTDAQANLGTLEQMRPLKTEAGISCAEKRATLFWVYYSDAPEQRSVLLYLKANITGDESTDVLQYRRMHPKFPHEPTEDQFFDEEQWESYRRLGEHMMASLCDRNFWFWSIKLKGGS